MKRAARDHRPAAALAPLAALMLLAALPLLVAPVPLMADLPNHIARHHLLARALFGDGDPAWTVGWRWIGNLGVDVPAVLLTPWLGAELATRLVVAAIAPLTVLGLLALGRAAHGRVTPGVALALPFAFAHPWHFGFVNSCLSLALALFAAAAWWRRPADGAARAAGFALAGLAVWSAHVLGWAVLLALAAGAELAGWRELRARPTRLLRALPLLAPLVPMLAWRGSGGLALFAFGSDPLAQKVGHVATVLRGIDRGFDLGMTAALALLGFAALAAARPRVEPRLAAAAGLLGLAFTGLPGTVLGSWGADLRLAPVAAMVALAAIGPARDPGAGRALIAAGLALFVVRAATITVQWRAAQPGLAARLALLDAVPRGGRLGFVYGPSAACRTPWPHIPDDKLASYAIVRRDAFANTMFRIPGADLIARARPGDAGWYDRSQTLACAGPRDQLPRRLAAMAAAGFDAIWVADPATVPAAPPGYRPARRTARDTIFVAAPLE